MSAKSYKEIIAKRESFNRDTLAKEKIKYSYPNGLNLRPGSDLSARIVREVQERVEASRRMTGQYEHEWRKQDWTLSAYMPADEYDKQVASYDSRRPTTATIPMAAANRETYLTYNTSVFCEDGPTQRYRGMGGPDSLVRGALHERVSAMQAVEWKDTLHLNSFWGDGYTYGQGLAAVNWRKKKAQQTYSEQADELMAVALHSMGVKGVAAGDMIRQTREHVRAEGTCLEPIDIYQAFFDPHTTPNNFQDSEFFGWIYRTSANHLLRREQDPEEQVFNAKYVKVASSRGMGVSEWWNRGSGRGGDKGNDHVDTAKEKSEAVDVIVCFVDLVPSDWGIGDNDYPTKYQVAISSDDIVIQCHPLDLNHGMFPAIKTAPNADGHTVMPVSHLTMAQKIFQFADWSLKNIQDFNNTILNGMIFFDPSMVEEEDMLNPAHGKLIRVKSGAYGEGGIDRFVHQVPVQDVTAGHMERIAALDQLARNNIGTGDIVMGRMEGMPDRPTKAGIQGAQQAQFSRLHRLAVICDEQCMRDYALMKAYNNQQFMSREIAVQLTGRYEQQLRAQYGLGPDEQDLMVHPWHLDGDVHVVPINAQLPGMVDTSAASELLKTFLAVEGVVPMIAKQYRISDLFASVFRRLGFEEIEEFRIAQATGQGAAVALNVMDDEQLYNQVERGNYVPVS